MYKRKYYSVGAKCWNCGWRGMINILKGTTISQAKCPKCGCISLSKGA